MRVYCSRIFSPCESGNPGDAGVVGSAQLDDLGGSV